MNKQAQKEQAIKYLQQLDIYKPYIKGFEENDHVCFFEHYAGFWVYQEPEIEAKMKAIEKEYKCTVYAITHEFMSFGECYSFLLVPYYKEDWDYLVDSEGKKHSCFAYVWNKDDDMCSELGTVLVTSYGGGIRRIG